jgi:hypothetical protein
MEFDATNMMVGGGDVDLGLQQALPAAASRNGTKNRQKTPSKMFGGQNEL